MGLLDADHVLRRAADPDRDVDAGLHRLARLADLPRERRPARVDDGPRGADRGVADAAREAVEQPEVLAAEAAAAADDDRSVLEPLAALLVPLEPAHPAPASAELRTSTSTTFARAAARLGGERAAAGDDETRRLLEEDLDVLRPADAAPQVARAARARGRARR